MTMATAGAPARSGSGLALAVACALRHGGCLAARLLPAVVVAVLMVMSMAMLAGCNNSP